MDEGRIHRLLGERIASRRRFLTGAGGLAAGALLAGGGSRSASAQAAVPDGEITVQFEIRGGVVEREVTSAIAALTAANPNAKINIAPPAAGDYIQELTIGLMTGQAADVF